MKLKDIPNILSTFRLILVFVFIFVYFGVEYEHSRHIALAVFVLAGLTDVVDGHLARKYNWISDLGKILDPLADKMMQCTVLVCLLISKLIPIWYAVPFILKEILILVGGFVVLKERKIIVVSNIVGKLAAFVFYAVVGLVMLLGDKLGPTVTNIICAISLFLTVAAFIIYTMPFLSSSDDSKKENASK